MNTQAETTIEVCRDPDDKGALLLTVNYEPLGAPFFMTYEARYIFEWQHGIRKYCHFLDWFEFTIGRATIAIDAAMSTAVYEPAGEFKISVVFDEDQRTEKIRCQ